MISSRLYYKYVPLYHTISCHLGSYRPNYTHDLHAVRETLKKSFDLKIPYLRAISQCVFIDLLVDIEYYFDSYEMSDMHKFQFDRRRLVQQDESCWTSLEIVGETCNRKLIYLWE